MAGKDPYAGIAWEEINESTALEPDEIKCLKNCFDLFDAKNQVKSLCSNKASNWQIVAHL